MAVGKLEIGQASEWASGQADKAILEWASIALIWSKSSGSGQAGKWASRRGNLGVGKHCPNLEQAQWQWASRQVGKLASGQLGKLTRQSWSGQALP